MISGMESQATKCLLVASGELFPFDSATEGVFTMHSSDGLLVHHIIYLPPQPESNTTFFTETDLTQNVAKYLTYN